MQVQIPAVWKEQINISKWSESSHNWRNRIFLPLVFWLSLKSLRRSVCSAENERVVYLPLRFVVWRFMWQLVYNIIWLVFAFLHTRIIVHTSNWLTKWCDVGFWVAKKHWKLKKPCIREHHFFWILNWKSKKISDFFFSPPLSLSAPAKTGVSTLTANNPQYLWMRAREGNHLLGCLGASYL